MGPWVIAKRVWGMGFATLIFREGIFFYSGIKQLFQVFFAMASPYNSDRRALFLLVGGVHCLCRLLAVFLAPDCPSTSIFLLLSKCIDTVLFLGPQGGMDHKMLLKIERKQRRVASRRRRKSNSIRWQNYNKFSWKLHLDFPFDSRICKIKWVFLWAEGVGFLGRKGLRKAETENKKQIGPF